MLSLTAISIMLVAYSVVIHIDVTNAASDGSQNKNGKWLKEKLKEAGQKVRDSTDQLRGPGSPIKGVPLCCL